MPKSRETLCRTIIKTLGWRATATTITVISTWLISGNLEDAFKVGAVDVIFKLSGHFMYEKLWSHCQWGYIGDNVGADKDKDSDKDDTESGVEIEEKKASVDEEVDDVIDVKIDNVTIET